MRKTATPEPLWRVHVHHTLRTRASRTTVTRNSPIGRLTAALGLGRIPYELEHPVLDLCSREGLRSPDSADTLVRSETAHRIFAAIQTYRHSQRSKKESDTFGPFEAGRPRRIMTSHDRMTDSIVSLLEPA